jgi:TonB family protein
MASAMTGEYVKAGSRRGAAPFSMIEQKGLLARLAGEISVAAREIARDPRGFVRGLLADDSRDARRRRRVYAGFACAVIAHVALFIVMVTLGWPSALTPAEQERITRIQMLPTLAKESDAVEETQPEVQQPPGDNGGGGGGGNNNPLPQIKADALPQMVSVPPQVPLAQPTVENASLPIAQTVEGPDSPPPPPGATVGDPNAKGEAPSAGPGEGGGIGDGRGRGVGSGDRGGVGPGSGGGNPTGRAAGSPEATGPAVKEVIWGPGSKPAGFSSFTWVYRPTPVVTPEAQAKKVAGTVLLRATFQADGRITDIEVVNPVDFMTESAKEALKRSKFRPATVFGEPVTLRRVLVRIDVHY